LRTSDQDGADDKIIAVPISKVDPRFDEIQTIEDLPAHVREEFLIYFKEYKKLEKAKYDKIVIEGFKSLEETKEAITKAMEAYKADHEA
jgi:inorganic pyrophosphatase